MVQKCFINLILVVNTYRYCLIFFEHWRFGLRDICIYKSAHYVHCYIGFLQEFTIDPSLSHTFLFCSISHQFATCGDTCQLWEHGRNEPIRTFTWNVDSLHHVAFNPIDKHILTACASDRSIILYDTRATGMDN